MISVSFAHDRLSVCVGDVALSLSNKVSYLSQDTLNNKLSTCKYLHINFCFSCQSSIKTGNDLFISIYSHSTMTKYKFWRQSLRLFQFLRKEWPLPFLGCSSPLQIQAVTSRRSFRAAIIDTIEKTRDSPGRSQLAKEVAKGETPVGEGEGRFFFRGQFEVK